MMFPLKWDPTLLGLYFRPKVAPENWGLAYCGCQLWFAGLLSTTTLPTTVVYSFTWQVICIATSPRLD
jgi:hypothetical protein